MKKKGILIFIVVFVDFLRNLKKLFSKEKNKRKDIDIVYILGKGKLRIIIFFYFLLV